MTPEELRALFDAAKKEFGEPFDWGFLVGFLYGAGLVIFWYVFFVR